jgi:hypothetical protein
MGVIDWLPLPDMAPPHAPLAVHVFVFDDDQVRVAICPYVIVVGATDSVTVGAGLIENVTAGEVPPPGAGLTTVTLAVPLVAMSVAAIAAVSSVAETYVVVGLLPFHCTVELEMKFVPFTVSMKPAPPAVPDAGDIEVTDGIGFGGWELDPDDDPPPHRDSPTGASDTTIKARALSIPDSPLEAFIVMQPPILPAIRRDLRNRRITAGEMNTVNLVRARVLTTKLTRHYFNLG